MDGATTDSSAHPGHGPESANHDYADDDDDASSSGSDGAQTGMKGIEAISQTWTRWSLIVAYLG